MPISYGGQGWARQVLQEASWGLQGGQLPGRLRGNLRHLEGLGWQGPSTHQMCPHQLSLEQDTCPARSWGSGDPERGRGFLPSLPRGTPWLAGKFGLVGIHGGETTPRGMGDGSTPTAFLQALLTPEDAVLSDELNHASIIDGIRLCKAHKYRYRHLDMADLEAKLQEAQVGQGLGSRGKAWANPQPCPRRRK